jgi:hypothetical protein
MTWLIYDNLDEQTQVSIGILLITGLVILFGIVGVNWIYEKLKK